jgi:hypothetical protein
MSEQWITFDEAAEIVRTHVGGSIGRAQKMAREAQASGEVRIQNTVCLWADDGLVGMDLRPGAQEKHGVTRDGTPILHKPTQPLLQVSKDDLLDWLTRQAQVPPRASARYPGDAVLIAEGRQMMIAGMEKRAVARKLAERAEGAGTFESKVDRLRRLL